MHRKMHLVATTLRPHPACEQGRADTTATRCFAKQDRREKLNALLLALLSAVFLLGSAGSNTAQARRMTHCSD